MKLFKTHSYTNDVVTTHFFESSKGTQVMVEIYNLYNFKVKEDNFLLFEVIDGLMTPLNKHIELEFDQPEINRVVNKYIAIDLLMEKYININYFKVENNMVKFTAIFGQGGREQMTTGLSFNENIELIEQVMSGLFDYVDHYNEIDYQRKVYEHYEGIKIIK